MKIKFKNVMVKFRFIQNNEIVSGIRFVRGRNTKAAQKRAVPEGAIIDSVNTIEETYEVDEEALRTWCENNQIVKEN